MVKFEFSKDYKTWTDRIKGRDITRYTIAGSYDVRQGYNLSETPRASTFSMDVVLDFELGKALLEYQFIRIYKGNRLTFTGILDPESRRNIETLYQQVISIKYIHLLSFLEEKEFSQSVRFTATDYPRMKVMDSSDPEHSLVHYLVGLLVKDLVIPFTFRTDFIARDGHGDPIKVLLFSESAGTSIWKVLNSLLREYGYIIRVDNTTLTISDILEESRSTGVELLDGADISVKTTSESMELPRYVKYYKVEKDVGVEIYRGRYELGGFLWWGKTLKDEIPLKYKREGGGVTLLDVEHFNYHYTHGSVVVGSCAINGGYRTARRNLRLAVGVYMPGDDWATADVTYAVYNHSVEVKDVPEGFYQTSSSVEPKYLYGADQVERYFKALTIIKRFKKTEWTFYSKVKLNVDDIVRFKDIPDSTCRIFEVQDTLEMDGGYTYRAFPFPMDYMRFEQREEYVEPSFGNRVLDIQMPEPIFIENGLFKKPKWRVSVLTDNTYINPNVTIDNVDYKIQYDSALKEYYTEVAVTDPDVEKITVSATINGYGITKDFGIYRVENRPVIIEYKYSTSSIEPEGDTFRIKYGDYSLYYGDYLLGWNGEEWTQQIPQGSQYENMYLWKRTWNYNIKDWVFELLTPVVKIFEITASNIIYPISKRQITDPVIYIKYTQKGIRGTVSMLSTAGTIVEDGDKQWKLTLPSRITDKTVTVTAMLGAEVRTITLTGVVQKGDDPIYWGKLETAPNPTDINLVEGDYYLAMDNIPHRWNGNEWKVVESTDSNYTDIMEHVMYDAFSDESQVIPSQSVIWQYVKNLMVNDATVENLVARNLKVEDKLKKFMAQIKGEDATPAVFEVKYDGKPIFKVVPEKGDIFLGEPNSTLTEPRTGFMYKADTQQILAPQGKFIVGADGAIEGDTIQLLTKLQDSNIRLNKDFFEKFEEISIPYGASDAEQLAIVEELFRKFGAYAYDVHDDASTFTPRGKILFIFGLSEAPYQNVNYLYYIDRGNRKTYYADNFYSGKGDPMPFITKYNDGRLIQYTTLEGFTFKGIVKSSVLYGNTEIRGNFRASNFYSNVISKSASGSHYIKNQMTLRTGNIVTYIIQEYLNETSTDTYLRITFPAAFKRVPSVFVNYEKHDAYRDEYNYGFITALTTTYVEISVWGVFDQHIMIIGEIDDKLISAIDWDKLQ